MESRIKQLREKRGLIQEILSLCVSGSSKISWISGNRGFRTRKI